MTEDHRYRGAAAGRTAQDGLLRPEPKPESSGAERHGMGLFCLALAGFALLAIYVSSPIDLPEFPDCPIQSIGHCGHY